MPALPEYDSLAEFANSLALALAAAGGYAAVWHVAAPRSYLTLILATYLAVAVVFVLQVARASAMTSWCRRGAAVLTVPAFAATVFAGLQPRPDCLDTLGCGRGLSFHPEFFVPFLVATAVLVTVDRRLD